MSKRVYVGPVGLEEKARLLSSARALLIPSLAAETSSLVAMEAASSGTPVVAFRSGALPEVVQHELTGFIADDMQSMVEAVTRIDEIQPSNCRDYALENFSSERMVDDYIKLYRHLARCLIVRRHLGMHCAPHDFLYGSSPRRKFQWRVSGLICIPDAFGQKDSAKT